MARRHVSSAHAALDSVQSAELPFPARLRRTAPARQQSTPAGKHSHGKLVAVRKIDMELKKSSRPGAGRHSQFGESNSPCSRTCILLWEDPVDYHSLAPQCMKLRLLSVISKRQDLIKEHQKLQGRDPGNEHQRHATWNRSAEVRDCLWHSTHLPT